MPELSLAKRAGALRREHVLCPVTALSFYRARNERLFVLSGEDTQLKVYDVESSELCATLSVFRDQSIHGILVREEGAFDGGAKVLIWGGSLVTALSREDVEDLLAGEVSAAAPAGLQAPDWIYDAVLSPTERDLGAIVTAHNEVIPLLVGADGRSLSFGRLRSPSRPILFSAKLAWDLGDSLIVGAGTAFGEIVMWKCSLRDDQAGDECEITYVFSGHEGSIFGVDISPELTLSTGEKTRLLASCSDDRTIRIWDLMELGKGGEGHHTVAKTFSEARETGFGSSYEDDAGPQNLSKPVAVVMSHISRIWHVKFAVETPGLQGGEGLIVYSFGEDATTQRWRMDFDYTRYEEYLQGEALNGTVSDGTKPLASLTQLAVYHSHSGKHIWSTAVQMQGAQLVATGGADGMINLIGDANDENSHSKKQFPILSFSIPEVLQNLERSKSPLTSAQNGSDNEPAAPKASTKAKASKRHKTLAATFNQYAFLSEDQLLTTTLSGRIVRCYLQEDELRWSEVEIEDHIREDTASWLVVRSVRPGTALLGSAGGSVYLYDTQGIRKVAHVEGKVADMFPLSETSGSADCELKVLITVLGRTRATLMRGGLASEPNSFSKTYIELDQGFIVTSAAFCGSFLVLGSRFGAILVYVQSEAGFERAARVEGQSKDAVASLVALPESSASAPPYFLATCRDGKYRIYEILTSSGSYGIELRHEASPPLGPMIEGALFTQGPSGEHHLILCGFRSKDFVVWNETTQQEIASAECGGAHRAFTYNIDPKHPERLCFIWTQASHVCIYRQEHMSHRPLKAGGHGREIRPLAGCSKYLATGAEDTAIRIWKYEDGDKTGNDRLRCLAVLEKHTAGIQCLKWSGNDYLLSSSGNEELFIWKVTTLKSVYNGLAVVCEATYPDVTPDGDLRILHFDVEGVREIAMNNSATRMLITLTLSNSTIKTYEYSKNRGFKLLSKGQYTGACIMQVRHLQMHEGDLHVLTASTDGHVAIWRAKSSSAADGQNFQDYSLVATARVHQSSIKSLDIGDIPSPQKTYLVVTGGDDNAMGSFRLAWDTARECYTISGRSIVNSIHAAAVTGIAVVKLSTASALIVTSSNDQRLKTWEVRLSEKGKKLVALLENRYSSVADTGGLEHMENGRLVVAGVGMEFWSKTS